MTTWNATYHTTRGPAIATRTWQWNQVFANEHRRDFVLVLQDRTGRLIGFTWGTPGGFTIGWVASVSETSAVSSRVRTGSGISGG